jgi:N-acetylglucosamine-6-phosphate deacetylase
MSGLVGREPGLIGASLNNPDCYIGLIADLHHVHPANISMTNKLKGDHVYLVTDALSPVGTDNIEFDYNGKLFYVKDDKCVDKDGKLGGTVLTLNKAIKNCVD